MRRKLFTVGSAVSLMVCVGAVVLDWWNDIHLSEYGGGLRFSRGHFWFEYSQGHWEIGYLPPHGDYFYLRFWFWPVIVMTAILPLTWFSLVELKAKGIKPGKALPGILLFLLLNGWLFGSAALAEAWADGKLGWWAILIAVISLVAFAWTVQVFARRKTTMDRRKNGQCLGCGYSLTGNASGVCPECGLAVESGRETQAELVRKGI